MEVPRGRRGPLTLLAVLTFARVAYGVQFQSVGAVGPAMIADLGLDYASLGTLVGAYSVLGLALSLPAGWLIARLGDRRIALAGLGLLVLGGFLLAAAQRLGAMHPVAPVPAGTAAVAAIERCPPVLPPELRDMAGRD